MPSYRMRPNQRGVAAAKCDFEDVGGVNFLSKRETRKPRGELFRKAFKKRVVHEPYCYDLYRYLYGFFY